MDALLITTAVKTGSTLLSNIATEYFKDGKKSLEELGDLDRNYAQLVEEGNKICVRRNDVQNIINQDKTKPVKEECLLWIDRVNKLEKDIEALKTRYDDEKLRFDLNKCLKEKFEEVQRCWTDGSNFATVGVTVEKPPEPVIKINNAPRIDDKKSFRRILGEVLRSLRRYDVRRIALLGFPGVGKTAILQNLNNSDKISRLFDMVIFVTVAEEEGDRERMVRKLQNEIAVRLKLDVGGITSMETIASRIRMKLTDKRCLLLLDDVWDMGLPNLQEIGISGTEENTRVVLATRHQHIVYTMDVDQEIKVFPLSNDEALKLFMEKLGEIDPSLHGERKEVIEECGGLALVIDRVARAFKSYKEIRSWRDGLKKLRKWRDVKTEGMDEVLQRLRFCYDKLDGEDIKLCFLYCALFTNGSKICKNYLLECWMAEGFVQHNFVARDIMRHLISASLLEDGENLRQVRMNKVMRNLALKISTESGDSKIVVRAGEKLPDCRQSWRDWKEAKWISLMDSELRTLPEKTECSKLSTLLLQRNLDLELIPGSFFASMQTLKVLDLHGTKISALQPWLLQLKSLKALYFSSCRQLTKVPFEIEKLEHLEVLDIRGTAIDTFLLPVGKLRQLRRLRFSLTTANAEVVDQTIPQHGISELKLLEEVVIDVHPDNESWFESARVLAEELAKLTTLTSLSFCFPNVENLEYFITNSPTWKEMDDCFEFKFSIGFAHPACYTAFDYDYDVCRCLIYANGVREDPTISQVLAETNAFELIGHGGASSLSGFGIQNTNKMRSCSIKTCNEMNTIVKGDEITTPVFMKLEKMFISNCPKLESIWEGQVRALAAGNGTLSQLTTLDFSKCPKLKKIFSRGMIQQLSNLQHLEVKECEEIEEIVMESENDGQELGELPSLTTLTLRCLPKLKSIWNDRSLKNPPPITDFKISDCPVIEFQIFTKTSHANVSATNEREPLGENLLPPETPEIVYGDHSGFEIKLTGMELSELPKAEEWEVSKLIHLNDSQLLKLPENPRCPVLEDLSLKGNSKLRTIPPLFFDWMPALRVLDLSRIRIKSLPDSLFSLPELKRLFLRHCNLLLKLSPKVGQLKGLQVLDLEGTGIMNLPEEVKELENLMCLKVSFCELPSYRRVEEPDVLMISPGTLSALPLLEELSINVSPDDGRWNECVEPVVSEVSALARLYKLQFYFPSMKFLSHFQWSRFKAFKLTAGHLAAKRLMPRLPSDAEAELERYDKSFTSVHGDFESEMNNPVLQHADALFLDRHTTMKTLSVFGLDSFKHLRCCVVGECNELQVLFCVGQYPPQNSLEYLYLYYMKSLRHIWKGRLPPMVHLKSLTLRTCPMLSSIFSEDLIGSLNSLKSLQEIIIDDCPAIINLVRCNGFECTSSSGTARNNFLPRLKRISLHYLPRLNGIFDLFFSRDLEWMSIYHCQISRVSPFIQLPMKI